MKFGCERYKSLLAAMISLGAEVTVARDVLALHPRKTRSLTYRPNRGSKKRADSDYVSLLVGFFGRFITLRSYPYFWVLLANPSATKGPIFPDTGGAGPQ